MANKTSRHTVNFTNTGDIEAVCLAQMGLSNRAIQRHVPNLTNCQITYRLAKAKNAEGLPKGVGYRFQWRDGSSPIAKEIANQVLPSLRREAKENLPPHFLPKREAQTVKPRS